MSAEIHRFIWQKIEIEVTYTPLRWDMVAHLEVRSINPEGAPLPITETGYLSDFFEPGLVEANDLPLIEQVRWWLDARSLSSEWQRHLARREEERQLSLF